MYIYEYSTLYCVSRSANLTHKQKNYLMKRGKTMKKLTKTILSVAAVSALTAAMAVSASAMTARYEAGVDGGVSKVILEDVQSTGNSQTILILNENAEVISETNANDVVEAIDQKDGGGVFTEVPVNPLSEGVTYYVRIGGTELVDGTIQQTTFKAGEDEDTPNTRLLGDVDGNGDINVNDVPPIVNHVLGKALLTGDDFKAADTDPNNDVNVNDVPPIVNFVLGKNPALGTATIK